MLYYIISILKNICWCICHLAASASVVSDDVAAFSSKEQTDKMAEDWYRRAEMAVEKGDDELAKEALTRRQTAVTKARQLTAFHSVDNSWMSLDFPCTSIISQYK